MYYNDLLDASADVALLYGPDLPPSKRFETLADVVAAWGRARALLGDPTRRALREALNDIDSCVTDGWGCARPLCPRCARLYRRWVAGQVIKQVPAAGGSAYFITAYGQSIEPSGLHRVSIKKFHNRFRQRLRRAGLAKSIIVGGTELSWRAREKLWCLHLHLVAANATKEALEALRKACGGDLMGQPAMVARPIYDLGSVATYMQKFSLTHRPVARMGQRRPGLVPLPRRQARELARFLLDHSFEDFLFLSGCRRRGSKIVPTGVTT
jgi:hypothetical protein